VSRGGNLLLDIGPDADGTIPVIMEQRLAEIGSWLSVNGDAIYGTRPHAVSKQWSDGEVPKIDYNKEYDSTYDVSKLTGRQPAGKASIEAFFTRKGRDVYAILTRWPADGSSGRTPAPSRRRRSRCSAAGRAALHEDRERDRGRPPVAARAAAVPASLGAQAVAVGPSRAAA